MFSPKLSFIYVVCFLIVTLVTKSASYQMPGSKFSKNPIFSNRIINRATSSNELNTFEPTKPEVKDLRSFETTTPEISTLLLSTVVASLVLFAPPDIPVAHAAASDYGIFAGRTASLLHPFSMFAFFGTSLFSGYLGLQWRRVRDLASEIKELSNTLPSISTGKAKYPLVAMVESINSQKASADEATVAVLEKDLSVLQSSSAKEIDAKIAELTEQRKNILAAGVKDKHHLTGSILLGGGVTTSVLGAFNTYMRAGKLFPGPHLYGGMAVTILWALAASLVPQMQKGNDTARSLHIALNTINVLLFAYQIPTGIEIMLKVIEKTSWP